MTNAKTPSNRLDSFEKTYAKLSDSVIAPVIPTHRARGNVGMGSARRRRQNHASQDENAVFLGIYTKARGLTDTEIKSRHKKKIRREQIRASQARYRQKQRAIEPEAQQSIQQLNKEIHSLDLKRQRLQLQYKCNSSPWGVVCEVFALFNTSFRARRFSSADEMENDGDSQRSWAFLKENLSSDVALGELRGQEALLEQLRRYSLYFGEPQLQLKRIESVVSGVMKATAALGVTITEFTLQTIFPHLVASEFADNDLVQLGKRLLGQRLHCNCCVTFFFDEYNGLLCQLEIQIDFLKSLLRVVGSLEDVSIALEKALIPTEGALGELTRS